MWLYKILICTVSFCLPFSYAISLIPTCSDYYGSPDRRDCTNLLSPYSTDTAQRFLSVPLVSVRPEGVAIIAWALRKTLPWVRDQHNCNIALISVLQINGKYSEAVASYADILQHEFAGRRKSMPGGIIWDCLATSRVGGWRRVRK